MYFTQGPFTHISVYFQCKYEFERVAKLTNVPRFLLREGNSSLWLIWKLCRRGRCDRTKTFCDAGFEHRPCFTPLARIFPRRLFCCGCRFLNIIPILFYLKFFVMAKHHPDLIFCRKQPGVGEFCPDL